MGGPISLLCQVSNSKGITVFGLLLRRILTLGSESGQDRLLNRGGSGTFEVWSGQEVGAVWV